METETPYKQSDGSYMLPEGKIKFIFTSEEKPVEGQEILAYFMINNWPFLGIYTWKKDENPEEITAWAELIPGSKKYVECKKRSHEKIKILCCDNHCQP